MLNTKKSNDKNLIYHVIHLPIFGKLEFNSDQTNQIITFTQKDIDEGIF